MAGKTEVKLDFSVDMLKEYNAEGEFGKELKELNIKFEPFTYKGTIETDEADLTEKKIVKDLKRAGRSIFVQFAMGVDGNISDILVKKKTDRKNAAELKTALAANLPQIKKDSRQESDAAHKRLHAMMKLILKEYSGDKGGSVDFGNIVEVKKFVKSLGKLDHLDVDCKKFKEVMKANGRTTDFGKLAGTLGHAYDVFTSSDSIRLVETVRKFPKVSDAKVDGKSSEADKKKAAAMGSMAEVLVDLRKNLEVVADEVDKIREEYKELQELLAGHEGSGAREADIKGVSVQELKIRAKITNFPVVEDRNIKSVTNCLDKTSAALDAYDKANK